MAKTETSAAWAAEHQQRARADRLAAMVESRDKRIARATADAAKLRADAAKLRARVDRLWAMVGRQRLMTKTRDATIAQLRADHNACADEDVIAQAAIDQLRADLAARDNTLRVEVAARDKRIVAQRDEMDARGKRITDLIISFNGEVAAVAERDATIAKLQADA